MTARAIDYFAGNDLSGVKQGFSDPVMNSQSVFRKVLDAISYPGRITWLGTSIEFPGPLNLASASILLTLVDYNTSVWTDVKDSPELFSWLSFHCGSDITGETSKSLFALITDPEQIPDLTSFNLGSAQKPDVSATLIIQAKGLGWKNGFKLTGPGIQRSIGLQVEGIPDQFWEQRRTMQKLFPRGLDIFFTCGDSLVALPRTTVISGSKTISDSSST